jgi:nucleoid DNA-binding protein
MNKKEVAEAMSKKLKIKKYEAYYFIDLFIEVVKERLVKNEKVIISNFGSFVTQSRKKKHVINPVTKERMVIPPQVVVKFIPSRKFKIGPQK